MRDNATSSTALAEPRDEPTGENAGTALDFAAAPDGTRIARLTGALSPATVRAYRNGWRKWEGYARGHGTAPMPAEPEALAGFVDALARDGMKPTTIRAALAAVAAAHRIAGASNPATTEDVRAAVRRATREYRDAGGTVRQATGITAEVLARIEATAHQPRPRGTGMESAATAKARGALDVAIIRTMRDCLARVSEAASFTWQQIERHPDGSATLTFRRPKTDTDAAGYLSPATVAALDAARPDDGQPIDPLFRGLSASQIKRRIVAAAKVAGVEGASSHGCRVGMAQDLARAKGIELPAIMQAGGWTTETTVARYTARESARRGAVARFYAQQDG